MHWLDYANYFYSQILKTKTTKATISKEEVRELLMYIDYLNFEMDKDTGNILGVPVNQIESATVLHALFSPLCVTVGPDLLRFADLQVREPVTFPTDSFNARRFKQLVGYLLNCYKLNATLDTTLANQKKCLLLSDVCDNYMINHRVYMHDTTKPEFPVNLSFDMLERVGTMAQVDAAKEIIDNIISTLTGKRAKE